MHAMLFLANLERKLGQRYTTLLLLRTGEERSGCTTAHSGLRTTSPDAKLDKPSALQKHSHQNTELEKDQLSDTGPLADNSSTFGTEAVGLAVKWLNRGAG